MQRDLAKQEVPAASSVKAAVEAQWKKIYKQIYNDFPFSFEIGQVEELIAIREGELTSGHLNPAFDWRFDIDAARFTHRFNQTWVEHHKAVRDRAQSYWIKWSEDTGSWLREFAQSAQKSLLLLHGAVAIGALNALVQHSHDQIAAAAKFALFFAIIGIIALVVGQIILFNVIATASNYTRALVSTKIVWRRLRALWKYNNRRLQVLRAADILVFGSAIWFCVYSIIIFIILTA